MFRKISRRVRQKYSRLNNKQSKKLFAMHQWKCSLLRGKFPSMGDLPCLHGFSICFILYENFVNMTYKQKLIVELLTKRCEREKNHDITRLSCRARGVIPFSNHIHRRWSDQAMVLGDYHHFFGVFLALTRSSFWTYFVFIAATLWRVMAAKYLILWYLRALSESYGNILSLKQVPGALVVLQHGVILLHMNWLNLSEPAILAFLVCSLPQEDLFF